MRTAVFPAITRRTALWPSGWQWKRPLPTVLKVTFHDASVERTSNGTGFIKNMTYDELLSLDIGAWKSPEFAGQHIWTFGQLLDFCKETKMLLNMELKNYEVFYENLEQRVIDEPAFCMISPIWTWNIMSSAPMPTICIPGICFCNISRS